MGFGKLLDGMILQHKTNIPQAHKESFVLSTTAITCNEKQLHVMKQTMIEVQLEMSTRLLQQSNHTMLHVMYYNCPIFHNFHISDHPDPLLR